MKIGFRTWILIIAVVLSLLAISPSFKSGVEVKSINPESVAFSEGLRQGDIIKEINGNKVSNLADYQTIVSSFPESLEEFSITIKTEKKSLIFFTNESFDFVVDKVPTTKIQTGLDIRGGARALVQPEEDLTDSQLQDLIEVSSNRFNVFGISDVNIRGVSDLSGSQFMLIEVAGATPEDLEDLISEQGKFEARIGNETAFIGGNQDITSVCRNDATCAAITECSPQGSEFFCSYTFTIYLSQKAAERHADITEKLNIDPTTNGRYLDKNLTLILDDVIVDELLIGSDLKGQVASQISIRGSGFGETQEEAYNDAKTSMHRLQTILITGSLPYKLTIVKLDTISPVLGNQFVSLILLAGISAIIAVSLIVFIRYRKFKASMAILLTSFSELIIILGIASLIKWNLDLPSIAGILATIGTGVDQQIVILDEARTNKEVSIKERMKRALFVVVTTFFTAVVSLIPLYWAGAGLFKGFAITSLIGITAGVIITRPAFAEMIKKMEN